MHTPGHTTFFAKAIVAMVGLFAVAAMFLTPRPADALDTTPPVNDHLESAKIIRGDSAFVPGDNRLATREKGELDHILSGTSLGQNSVWFRWTAWTSGPMNADVCQSNFDTIIAIYAKDEKGNLDPIIGNDDACSSRNERGSSVVFEAEIEDTYWIAVSGYSKASAGSFTLRLSPAFPPTE